MHHLVLADDSVTIQKVVELTFADEDFQVHSFSDGASALEYLKDQPVDVLLADIFLPFVDGYDLCRAVRRNNLTAHIPVILLAGTFEPFDNRRAESAGYSSCITKPFETSYLVGHVREMIERVEKPVPAEDPEAAAPPPQEEEIPGQVFTFPIPGMSNGETVNLQLRPEDCLSSLSLLRRDALVGPRIRYKRKDAAATSAAAAEEPAAEAREDQEEIEDLHDAAPAAEGHLQEPPAEAPAEPAAEVSQEAEERASFAVEPAESQEISSVPAAEGFEEIRETPAAAFEAEQAAEPVAQASAVDAAQAPAAETPPPASGLTDEQLELIAQKILSRLPQELRRWLPEVAEEIIRPDKQDP
jgi:CheY-like chemotaxis protein